MKKFWTRCKHWYVVVPVLLAVMAGVAVGSSLATRAWINHHTSNRYLAKKMLQDKVKLLAPLHDMGFGGSQKQGEDCFSSTAYGHTVPRYQCVMMYSNYVVIGDSQQAKDSYVQQAKQLDQLLKQDGWIVEGNSADSFGEWFTKVTGGQDYSTDMDASKNTPTEECSLVFNVAYSKPKPPAYTIRMSCGSPALYDEHGATFIDLQ